jgi:hypothetical protein
MTNARISVITSATKKYLSCIVGRRYGMRAPDKAATSKIVREVGSSRREPRATASAVSAAAADPISRPVL